MNRLLMLLLLGVPALLIASACGGGSGDGSPTSIGSPTEMVAAPCESGPGLPADASGEQLVIGLLVSSAGGSDEINAANLAAKCLNDAGGVNGGPVVILTGDIMSDESGAATEADRLVSSEGVVAIIGAMSADATTTVAETVTIPHEILYISSTAYDETGLSVDDGDFVFSMPTSADGAEGDTFDAMYLAEYGAAYTSPAVRQTFDAVLIIGLAAEAARANTDSTAIRDSLRGVANAPGSEAGPSEGDITSALVAIAGGEDVDYQGASNSVNFD